MHCLCTLCFDGGMEGVWYGGLIHVDNVAWIFPQHLVLHELNEVTRLFFSFMEVLLCRVGCYAMRWPHLLRESVHGFLLRFQGFVPERR